MTSLDHQQRVAGRCSVSPTEAAWSAGSAGGSTSLHSPQRLLPTILSPHAPPDDGPCATKPHCDNTPQPRSSMYGSHGGPGSVGLHMLLHQCRSSDAMIVMRSAAAGLRLSLSKSLTGPSHPQIAWLEAVGAAQPAHGILPACLITPLAPTAGLQDGCTAVITGTAGFMSTQCQGFPTCGESKDYIPAGGSSGPSPTVLSYRLNWGGLLNIGC